LRAGGRCLHDNTALDESNRGKTGSHEARDRSAGRRVRGDRGVAVIDCCAARVRVTVAGLGALSATGSHAITVACDARFEDCDRRRRALVLPAACRGEAPARARGGPRAVAALDAKGGCWGDLRRATVRVVRDTARTPRHQPPAHAHEMTDCVYENGVVEDGTSSPAAGGTSIEFAAALIARLAARTPLAHPRRIQHALLEHLPTSTIFEAPG